MFSSFTVRKISFGEGVERTFALYSPIVGSIKVIRSGKVRRAKLYYLRERTGKSARITEKIKKKLKIKFYVDNSHKKTRSNHGNIIATIISDPKLPTVVLSSHMDTVVPGKGIKPIVKQNYVTSSGDTILGSDDKRTRNSFRT